MNPAQKTILAVTILAFLGKKKGSSSSVPQQEIKSRGFRKVEVVLVFSTMLYPDEEGNLREYNWYIFDDDFIFNPEENRDAYTLTPVMKAFVQTLTSPYNSNFDEIEEKTVKEFFEAWKNDPEDALNFFDISFFGDDLIENHQKLASLIGTPQEKNLEMVEYILTDEIGYTGVSLKTALMVEKVITFEVDLILKIPYSWPAGAIQRFVDEVGDHLQYLSHHAGDEVGSSFIDVKMKDTNKWKNFNSRIESTFKQRFEVGRVRRR